MADRVTWEVCPACGDLAALGWIGDEVTEFDCYEGCSVPLGLFPIIESGPFAARSSALG